MEFMVRDGAWIEKAKEVVKLQQERKKLEKLEALAAEQLKQLSEGVSSKGGGFVYEASVRKGTVEYALIPELKGINLDSYRKDPSIVWKLSMELVD